jgi:sugar phosphate isomerase/epimerase
MIEAAGALGAFAVIGSIQGKSGGAAEHETAVGHLREALDELGTCAANYGVPLVYEPLNRYETNLCNTVEQGMKLLDSLSTSNVKLLADLFHMNIEEVDLAAALRSGKHHVGHLHFVDSNRRPAGCVHIDYAPIAAALRDVAYEGYASAEALPYPDSLTAARLTRETFQRHFS